ncbi:MAG: O-antigen ligase family protein [Bacteroidota bacterium]|nr:O-antigen ligase family protein [Bacteroidota bacterium]
MIEKESKKIKDVSCCKDSMTFFRGWTFENYWFSFCLTLIFFGMLCSPFVASVARGLIIIDLALHLIFWKKRVRDFKQKIFPLLSLSALYLMDIVGILWSNDWLGAKETLLHEYNFLIIPLFIALYSPLKKNVLSYVILAYLFMCWLGVAVGSFNYLTNNYTDIRHIVIGTRHIAFAINIAFATCLLMTYTYNVGKYKKIIIPIIIWQISFLVVAQMISGLLTCLAFVFLSVIYLFIKKRNKTNVILFFSLLVFLCLSFAWVYKEYNNYFSAKESFIGNESLRTKDGNVYTGIDDGFIENGYLVNNYVCKPEVERQWQERTGYSLYTPIYDSSYLCSDVIYRYLNSKGLHKDAEGVKQLTEQDIDNICHGIANVAYTEKYSLRPRLYQTFFEFERFFNANETKDMSIVQRIVMSKTAFNIIKQHWLIGTGTGAEKTSLQKELSSTYPVLSDKQADPHNQFIYIMVGFGVLGLVFFLVFTTYPIIKFRLWQNKYSFSFFVVLFCYMFSESCLRMMAGEIFFTLFYALLIFNNENIKKYYLL